MAPSMPRKTSILLAGLVIAELVIAELVIAPPARAANQADEPAEDRAAVAVDVEVHDSAPVQAFFTFFPIGLASDPAGRAQFSHLAEHMMIRSTDPDGLQVDGVHLNGETGAALLRLESYGPPERWEESLDRHLRWIGAEDVDDEVLEREKGRVIGEVTFTAENGFVGKFAIAAWNQVARHGQPAARVVGDIESATADDVRDYLATRVPGGDIHIVAVGPIPADEIRARVAAHPIRLPQGAMAAATADPARAPDTASWDVDSTALVVTAPLAVESPRDRAACITLARILQLHLMQSVSRAAPGARPIASCDARAPEATYAFIAVGGLTEARIAPVREALDETLDRIAEEELDELVPMVQYQLHRELLGPWDFPAMRAAIAARGNTDLIEVQTMLTRHHQLLGAGLTPASASDALDAVDAETVNRLARALAAPNRKTLLLRPAAP